MNVKTRRADSADHAPRTSLLKSILGTVKTLNLLRSQDRTFFVNFRLNSNRAFSTSDLKKTDLIERCTFKRTNERMHDVDERDLHEAFKALDEEALRQAREDEVEHMRQRKQSMHSTASIKPGRFSKLTCLHVHFELVTLE